MNDSPQQFPVIAWTWHDGKGGILSTQISANGQVEQQRKNVKDDAALPQKLGEIPSSQATALLTRCRAALSTPETSQALFDVENYELVVAEIEGQKTSRQVARAAFSSDAAMQSIRQEILDVRRKVARRWNIWRSAGARWFYLMTAVTLALGIYIASDMKRDDELQMRSHKASGLVIERGGTPFKSEFLKVRLDGEGHAPEVKISKYLSHPNWEAAKVGRKVDVLYDADSGQAWLASDLLRWQRDKKTIWLLPGFLLVSAFVGWAWLRRFQIGAYGDGNEYMIHQDRVVTDDKDAAVSRSTLLWFKMFV